MIDLVELDFRCNVVTSVHSLVTQIIIRFALAVTEGTLLACIWLRKGMRVKLIARYRERGELSARKTTNDYLCSDLAIFMQVRNYSNKM